MDKILNVLKFCLIKTNRWHRAIFIFALAEFKLIPGGQIGFTCNDPALSYQFNGDTINWKWILSIPIVIPLIIVLLVERIYNNDNKSIQRTKDQALLWYKEHLFGYVINLTLVQTIKRLIGAPRPHFFHTCKPEEALTCKGSEYVSHYTCTNTSYLSESNKSFPSGHTSLALQTAVFLVYYLYRRMNYSPHSHVATCIQVLCILSAVFCSVSRLIDHRHHWWDVLAGAAIGIIIALYTIHSCDHFKCRNSNNGKTAAIQQDSAEAVPLN